MQVYLSKKIAIAKPQANQQVNSLTWNSEYGWIGVGGQQGLLKVLKLDDDKKPEPNGQRPAAGQGGLSVNHTLENHSGSVTTVIWNEKYNKLTSSDSDGLIIVWMLHNNQWFEEMINNRNKSKVTDMCWSPDGLKVCIVYLDGAVILGSVDGQRLWGKDYKHEISLVNWSPDSRLILFGTPSGEIRIYDENGNPLHQLKMTCLKNKAKGENYYTPELPLASIQWYQNAKMYTDDTPCGLCIAYECGRIQLMKNDKDDSPILIDTLMTVTSVRWNPAGTLLAISGTKQKQSKGQAMVQFYNNQGAFQKELEIPQSEVVNAIAWEGTGLRIAMTVGPQIFFANVKLDHKWGWLNTKTVVYGYQKKDRIEYSIIFWDTKTGNRNIKFVKGLCDIMACQDLCCVITKFENDNGEFWQLDLCNSIGSPIDTKYINIEPTCCCMTKTHIIITSEDHIYIWEYRNQAQRLTSFEAQNGLTGMGREICWFIDETPDATKIYDYMTYDFDQQQDDYICAITANENWLLVGRISGKINKYTLPHIQLENKLFLKNRPRILAINCDSTKLAVVDIQYNLSIMINNNDGGQLLDFEKKDVWNVKFSEDNPDQFAMAEKSRMYTVHGVGSGQDYKFEVDDPVTTEAFICEFKDLQVTGCYLDDFIKLSDGSNINQKELIVQYETSILKKVKETIKLNPMEKVFDQIMMEFPDQKCICSFLAKKALEELDFNSAEKAFLKLEDYQGLQFLKRITNLDDKEKQRAWILVYYNQFDEAEEVFINMQRKDLAIDMRSKLGDWKRVLQLAKGGDHDEILQNAQKQLGIYHSERYEWAQAAKYFALAKDIDGQIEAYSQLEDYDSLELLIPQIPDNSHHLLALAEKFQLIGLCDNAVKCFERAGEPKKALDCCVLLNHWNLATELADQYGFPQVEGLLNTYANQLLEKNQKLEAAELYRKAKHNTEAAKLLSQIAVDLEEKEANPLDIKKLYVMAALEVDLYKKRVLDQTMTGQNIDTAKTLNSLITSTINTSSDKILQNPWRGAEAWHFFLLCQKQMYAKNFRYALKTALRLQEYELDLEPRKIYSVMAIAAYYNKSYKQLSRAFVKLEGIKDLQPHEREIFQQIAVSVFTKHEPVDGPCEKFQCPGKHCKEQITEYETHCNSCGANFSSCVASGRAILEKEFYSCKACRHKMIESEVKRYNLKNCALCHSPVDPKRFGISDAK